MTVRISAESAWIFARARGVWCTGRDVYRKRLSATVNQGYYGGGGYDTYKRSYWIVETGLRASWRQHNEQDLSIDGLAALYYDYVK